MLGINQSDVLRKVLSLNIESRVLSWWATPRINNLRPFAVDCVSTMCPTQLGENLHQARASSPKDQQQTLFPEDQLDSSFERRSVKCTRMISMLSSLRLLSHHYHPSLFSDHKYKRTIFKHRSSRDRIRTAKVSSVFSDIIPLSVERTIPRSEQANAVLGRDGRVSLVYRWHILLIIHLYQCRFAWSGHPSRRTNNGKGEGRMKSPRIATLTHPL